MELKQLDKEVAYRAPCGCTANSEKFALTACSEARQLIKLAQTDISARFELYDHYKDAFILKNKVLAAANQAAVPRLDQDG